MTDRGPTPDPGPDLLWVDRPPQRPVTDHEPFAGPSVLAPRPTPRAGLSSVLARLRRRPRPPSTDDIDAARCRRPVPGGRRIAVISRKGGVGKTTATLMLGHTFAAVRSGRVLAIDGNPDAGTLGHRVARQTDASVLDVLDDLEGFVGYPDVRRVTSQAPSRLEVLASPTDPHASRALSGRDYQQVMDRLHRHFQLLLVDTGTGILDDANLGILDAVDQVVLVSGVGMDTARAAAQTLDWMEANGRGALARDAVVVINSVGELGRIDLDVLTGHFTSRVRAVHHVPYDRQLEAGSITDPDTLTGATQSAWLAVAASVADGFGLPSPRDLPREPS